MTVGIRTGAKTCGALLVIGSLTCALLQIAAQPTTAMADPVEELQAIQKKIQQGNEDYEKATARIDDVQADIDANEERIADLEEKLPDARKQAATSMRTNYKLQQSSGGILSLILSSEDFYELLTMIQYLDVIQEYNNEAVDELLLMADELEAARVTLNSQMQEAEAAQTEAQEALDAANKAREELYEEIRAQAEAEAAQRRAAIEAAKRRQEQLEQESEDGSSRAGAAGRRPSGITSRASRSDTAASSPMPAPTSTARPTRTSGTPRSSPTCRACRQLGVHNVTKARPSPRRGPFSCRTLVSGPGPPSGPGAFAQRRWGATQPSASAQRRQDIRASAGICAKCVRAHATRGARPAAARRHAVR